MKNYISACLIREKSAFIRALLVLPAMVLLHLHFFLELLSGTKKPLDSMYDVLMELLYGGTEVESIMAVSVSVIFVLLFGTELYRQLGADGIYYFSRQKSRAGWFVRATVRLFFYALLWCLLQFGFIFLTAHRLLPEEWNREYAMFLTIHLTVMVLFNFFLVYLVNILAMCIGSTFAFIAVYMGCEASFYFGNVFHVMYAANADDLSGAWRMYLLPSELLQVHWKGEQGALLHQLSLYRRTWIGMGVTGVVLAVLFTAGLLAVRRMDIGLTDKERIL